VEYQLTALGESLLDPLQNLLTWVNVHAEQVRTAQDHFDHK
jgi:DNA-binding HxlR family transcriptional regulator